MDIDMSATRQQMLETAERLNQQMADGIPFTWETLEQALASVTEQDDKGIQYDRYCGTYAEQPVAGHGTVR